MCKMNLRDYCLFDGCRVWFEMGRGSLSPFAIPRMFSGLETSLPSLPLLTCLQNVPIFFLPEFCFPVNTLLNLYQPQKLSSSFLTLVESLRSPLSEGKALSLLPPYPYELGSSVGDRSLTDVSFRWPFLLAQVKCSVWWRFMPFKCINHYPSQGLAHTGSGELVEYTFFHLLYSMMSCW